MESARKTTSLRFLSQVVSLALVACLSFGALIWFWDRLPVNDWLGRFKFLEVKTVKVSCGWPLTVSEVKSWLPSLEGRNIFLLQPSRLMAILEAKPWVSSVTIRKNYPDQVIVEIATKTPRALLAVQSQIFYVDETGTPIDRISSSISKELDLPLINIEKDQKKYWKLDGVIKKVGELPARWKNAYKISQVVLEDYPYLKIYLSSPRVEVSLSFDRWENSVGEIPLLIQNPPNQIRQVRRINLVFPKKAIVSSSLSQ